MVGFAGRRMNIDTSAGMPGRGRSIEQRTKFRFDPFRCFRSDGLGGPSHTTWTNEMSEIKATLSQGMKREWKISGIDDCAASHLSFDPKAETVTFYNSHINYVIINLGNLEIRSANNEPDPSKARVFASLSTGKPLGQKAKDRVFDLISCMKNYAEVVRSSIKKADISGAEREQISLQFDGLELLFNFLYRYSYHK
jgi:hypothetical protein